MTAAVLAIGSCRKDEFDEPPSNGVDPTLAVNMTLDSLKKMYQPQMQSNKIVTITNDWTVKGVVVADDKSGNYYKNVVIDDGTAGITIRIDISNFNTTYPVGRQLYVKLKGLHMGTYGGLVQMGGYIDSTSGSSPSVEPIPASLVNNHFVAGTWKNPVIPYTVTINDLNNTYKWQSRLIKMDQVQFAPSDTGKTWADIVGLASVNHDLQNCNTTGIIYVRTSGYSNFAGQLTPGGSGSITGVFSIYNSDMQLAIRDLNDVNMTQPRFSPGSCGNPPPSTAVYSDISALRSLYNSGTSFCPDVYIRGVVISDKSTSNINAQNLYIQDNSGGIQIRFSSAHNFNLGDSIKVTCSGYSLYEYNGLLQIGGQTPNVPTGWASLLASGKSVTPRLATIADLLANQNGVTDPWEGTLVQVLNVNFIGGGTYSGSKQITDGTDTITVFTSSAATFSGASVPTTPVDVTAILYEFTNSSATSVNQQLMLRSTSDVQ